MNIDTSDIARHSLDLHEAEKWKQAAAALDRDAHTFQVLADSTEPLPEYGILGPRYAAALRGHYSNLASVATNAAFDARVYEADYRQHHDRERRAAEETNARFATSEPFGSIPTPRLVTVEVESLTDPHLLPSQDVA